MMETHISYNKHCKVYRYCDGQMSRPIGKEEAGRLLASWALDDNCSIGYAEDDDQKVWVPKWEA